jgi:hypothetical protein
MRCEKCQKEFATTFPETQYQRWLELYFYFGHELSEGEITEATYERMTDCLMSIKSTLIAEKD